MSAIFLSKRFLKYYEKYFFTVFSNFLLVSTGMGMLGPLENTEVLNLDSKDAIVPTYQNHKTSIYGAIGGFVSNQFITCGGYDFDNWEGTTNKCYKIGKTSSSLHGFMRE